ncbi:MAG TPA: hypothetical protein VGC01_09325, partial [Mucilaginibacter sp.]
MLKPFKILLFCYAIIALTACKQGAAPIPVIDFFKTPEKVAYKISPDGKYISYLKPYKDKQNLFIQSLEDGSERMATSFTDYQVLGDYFWAYNNEIVFSQDIVADDEFRMYALDLSTYKVRQIISEKKVRINLVGRNRQEPDIISIRMNKRDPANFDVYRLNIKTGALSPYLVNPGNIT